MLLLPLALLCHTTYGCLSSTATCPTAATVPGPGKFLYFAYGSNLFTERIRINNPSATYRNIGRLADHKLDFNHFSRRWRGAAATVVPGQGEEVWGVLWELEDEDLTSLDDQEGVPHVYNRIEVAVELPSGEEVAAVSYRLVVPLQEDRRPSGVYKDVIVKGAREHKLPQHYIDKLEQIEDNGYRGETEVKLDLYEM